MSTDQSLAVAQNVTYGIANPVRRSVGRIQGCDPPNAGDRSIKFGGTRPWFRPYTEVWRYLPEHINVRQFQRASFTQRRKGAKKIALTRVGICNPDPNVMSTDQSLAFAQNVTDGIKNPVRRSVGRIQGCDPPNAGDRTHSIQRNPSMVPPLALTRVGICNPDPNVMSTDQSLAFAQNFDNSKEQVSRKDAKAQRKSLFFAPLRALRETSDAGRDL